jgi:hypothetical protein
MQSKSEIVKDFTSKWKEVSSIVNNASQEQFVAKINPNVWSIAEEFDHVIKSATAVSSAMKVSPFILKWKFGRPNRPIRTYDEVLHKFTKAIASVGGKAVAPSSFRAEEGKAFDKENMLKHWESTLIKFDQRINKWSDKNLDKVLLPHPLLGKMMFREMLNFTHLHTEHHRKSLEKKANSLN